MKYLARGRPNFLETDLLGSKPTGKEVDPKTLVHFGTDLVADRYHLQEYLEQMEKLGVDYLFVSEQGISIESGQSEDFFRLITAYKRV